MALVLLALVVVAGCQAPSPGPTEQPRSTGNAETQTAITETYEEIWSLQLGGADISLGEHRTIDGFVAANGQFRGTASGVCVEFWDADGAVLKREQLGRISAANESWRIPFNTSLPADTAYVVPTVTEWQTPNTTLDQTVGVRVLESGALRSYSITDPAQFGC
ncbi:hypothetical protein HZS55_07940 [Halosimplex rubrum]|uniref:Uncharacterized protein n=1 Tax=Halosimplex rubrum TaxID=869889 RepID=A0A7D5NZM9_9EURY|nr:hypothetical protein [Halosimplex rubrum]QLH77226.1 hypothetical protein HZS55_07940 [Halosimplex rubrum]